MYGRRVGTVLLLGCGWLACGTESELMLGTHTSGVTASFQNGPNAYSGTVDGYISDQGGGNGDAEFGLTEAIVFRNTQDNYEGETMIRFDGLSLPAGSQVTGATLTLTFEDFFAGSNLQAFYLKQSWNPAAVGWTTRNTGQSWTSPGAKGVGSDVHAGAGFTDNNFPGTGVATKAYPLDPAIVQSWVNSSANNHGIILVNNQVVNKFLRVYTSRHPTLEHRPKLEIFYSPGGSGDSQPPSVTMTAPVSGGSAASGTITLSANASDNVGVAGVQFHVDNMPISPEDIAGPPWSISYNTTQLSNGVHTFAASARDAAGNQTMSAAVSATVTNTIPGNGGPHPRLILDTATLATLKARAQSTTPAVKAGWDTLRAKCETYANSTVLDIRSEMIGQECNPNQICMGYMGTYLLPAVASLGVCYQVGLQINDSRRTAWANKAIEILTEMSQYTNYTSNAGYGFRFFVPTMAYGYDWLHPLLSSTLKADLVARMNGWIDTVDAEDGNPWGRNHPVGNYSAAYYAGKGLSALATEGENPNAVTYWNDWFDRLHKGGPNSWTSHLGVARFFTSFLNGGGMPGGWQYAALSLRSMAEIVLGVRTAKGINLINGSDVPAYEHPLNNAEHLIHFTWPSLAYMDDRDTIKKYSSLPDRGCPAGIRKGNAIPPTDLATVETAMLAKPNWTKSFAPQFQDYAKRIRDLFGTEPWINFLHWDETAPRQSFSSLERSHLSANNYLAMRSSWNTDATWASFRTMPYADAHPYTTPDVGSLAITRGDTPFLVNSGGFFERCYGDLPNTPRDPLNPGTEESPNFGDYFTFGFERDQLGPKQNYNVFYVSTTAGQRPRNIDEDDPNVPGTQLPASAISRYDFRNSYVYARGTDLEDVYPSTVTSWARDVVFFRKSGETGVFVVYDRTSAPCGDPRLSWHFPPQPVANGAGRYDVTDSFGFKGSVSSVLPVGATMASVDARDLHKVYRVEIRPQACATDLRWVTVLDPATSAAAVHSRTAINLSAVKGVALANPGNTSNKVALFGAGATGTTVTAAFSFTMPTATTTKLIAADLQPNVAHSVTVTTSGATQTVTITPNAGSLAANSAGILHVDIASTGAVTTGS